MPSRSFASFLLSDLGDRGTADDAWFEEEEARGLAGRCLLDALEYLHVVPKFPGLYWHVVNAHTLRLVCSCLSDPQLKRGDVLERMKGRVLDTCRLLRTSRQPKVPYYGDDFWDWASVVEAFAQVRKTYKDAVMSRLTLRAIKKSRGKIPSSRKWSSSVRPKRLQA